MAIFNVSSAAELQNALSSATGGDEIRLAGGDYGDLSLRDVSFSSAVTITSANADNRASFSSLGFKSVENITFDNVDFAYDYSSGDKISLRVFQVRESSGITFRNGMFDGDDGSNGYPTGIGLTIRDSSDVIVENMDFTTWNRALHTTRSQNVTITGNEFYDIGGDALDFAAVQQVLIEGNYVHDFRTDPESTQHRDMIQFWTKGTDSPSTDITIRNNVLDIGDGTFTQSIFMRNEEVDQGRAGSEMYYQNILIEGNIITNAQTHGITVGEANGVVIQNNSVVAVEANSSVPQNMDRTKATIPTIYVKEDSVDVTIQNNITEGIRSTIQSGWNVSNNVDPESADIPLNDAGSTDDGVSDAPDSGESDNTDAGAADGTDSGSDNTDAGAVDGTDSGSDSTDAGTTDGTDSGSDNTGADAPVYTDASGVLNSFDDYILDIANPDEGVEMRGDAYVEGSSIVFDGNGDYVKLGGLDEFASSEQIAFTVEYTRDEADGSKQRLVWNHKKLGLSLDDDGLVVHVANTAAKFYEGFEVEDLGLNDTDAHRITVLVDQEADRLQVIVDDLLVLDETDTDFDFVDAGNSKSGWTLGTSWSRYVDGTVSDFRLDDDVAFIDAPVLQEDAGFIG